MIKKNSYTKSQINNHRLRKQIYEQVMSNIVTQLNENEMNELFGWGSGVSKPEKALTAEYIKEASTEELGENIAAWLNYWADSAKDGLDKALSSAITPCLEICQAGEESAKKLLDSLRSAVAKGLQNGLESTKNGAKALPRLIVMGIALCVKLAANGIDKAKQYAQSLYQGVIKFAKNLYTTCAEKIKGGIETIKEKADLLGKLACAIFTLVAHKITGAKEMCSAWIKEVIDAAKEKATMAVLIVRSWFAMVYDEAKEALKEFGNDLRNKIVDAYNAIDKSIRKAWNKTVEKVIEWCNAVRITVGKLSDKVKETLTAAGDAIIAGKDKVVVAGIDKAVKLLSKKYSEDDIVAIVRKAYNEGLTFNSNGSCIINECYYSNTHLSRV